MKLPAAVPVVVCAVLAACSWGQQDLPRPNDPYGSLSASEVYMQKGVRYMEIGNYEVALQDLRRAIKLDKRNSEAYNALGVLNQRLENYAEAEDNFEDALSANPDNFGARNNYGRLLCSRDKHEEGLGQFRKVMESKLYNTPWIPMTNAGLCARAAGRTAEAEQYLRKALELDPAFPPALLEMARVSRDSGQNMSARAFLQRYHGSAGPSPESLWLGIETEMALGNAEGAREYAATLRERFPGSKEAAQARRQFGAE